MKKHSILKGIIIAITVAILLGTTFIRATKTNGSTQRQEDYIEIRNFQDVINQLPYDITKEDRKRLLELNKEAEKMLHQNNFEKLDEMNSKIDEIIDSYRNIVRVSEEGSKNN